MDPVDEVGDLAGDSVLRKTGGKTRIRHDLSFSLAHCGRRITLAKDRELSIGVKK